MVRSSIAIALTFLAVTASADSRDASKAQISNLLQQMRADLNSSQVSAQDLLNVQNQLLQADRILLGQGGGNNNNNGGFNGRDNRMTCVSRDNDGQEPYQLAVTKSDFSVVKIQGAVLSKADCEAVRSNSQNLRAAVLTCLSRDNDGQNPYSLAVINLADGSAKKFNVFSDVNSCFSAIKNSRRSSDSIEVCASRDNDGNAPFVHVVYSSQDQSVRQVGDVYQNIGDCNKASNQ